MKYSFYAVLTAILAFALISCSGSEDKASASGNFEADEILVSSEAMGLIRFLQIDEGAELAPGAVVGIIDTVQLQLKKEQISAGMGALKAKTRDIQSQIDVFIEQKNTLLRDKARIEKLYKDSIATRKQLDDINGAIAVIDKNIIATRNSMETNNRGLLSEINPLQAQMRQMDDNLNKSYIKSPIAGTVLTKYADQGEIIAFGKPIFKIANLKTMNLKAYISGDQIAKVKIGQKVKVAIDDSDGKLIEYWGTVSHVSDKAEFTPKIVQTRKERVNLVYAVKVRVQNDGRIKIGMPGELYF